MERSRPIFPGRTGNRPKAVARLLTETADTTFVKMINVVSANKLKTSDRPMGPMVLL